MTPNRILIPICMSEQQWTSTKHANSSCCNENVFICGQPLSSHYSTQHVKAQQQQQQLYICCPESDQLKPAMRGFKHVMRCAERQAEWMGDRIDYPGAHSCSSLGFGAPLFPLIFLSGLTHIPLTVRQKGFTRTSTNELNSLLFFLWLSPDILIYGMQNWEVVAVIITAP